LPHLSNRLHEFITSESILTEGSVRVNIQTDPIETKTGLSWFGVDISPKPLTNGMVIYHGVNIPLPSNVEQRKIMYRTLSPEMRSSVILSNITDRRLNELSYKNPILIKVLLEGKGEDRSGDYLILTLQELLWCIWNMFLDMYLSVEIKGEWVYALIERGFYGVPVTPLNHSYCIG